MRKAEHMWRRFTEQADLPEEIFPGLPIVEIAGENRVLIENHMGVKGYSCEKIIVQVKYGWIHICGECMQLRQMSAEQLVICGRIHQVALHRRNG